MAVADVFLTIFIIIVFLIMIVLSVFTMGKDKFKKEWPKNKCNPSYMPLASFAGVDSKQNFSECIADIQGSMMGTFLGPINATLSGVTAVTKGTMNSMDSFRGSLAYVKNLIPAFQGDLGAIFSNLIIYGQKTSAKLADTVERVISLTVVMMHFITGLSYTGKSLWCGHVGTTMRAMEYGPFNAAGQKKAKCEICTDDEECK